MPKRIRKSLLGGGTEGPQEAGSRPVELLGAADAAAFLNVGVSTLYRWTAARRLPHVFLAGTVRRSALRFLRSDLEEFLKRNRVEAASCWEQGAGRWR